MFLEKLISLNRLSMHASRVNAGSAQVIQGIVWGNGRRHSVQGPVRKKVPCVVIEYVCNIWWSIYVMWYIQTHTIPSAYMPDLSQTDWVIAFSPKRSITTFYHKVCVKTYTQDDNHIRYDRTTLKCECLLETIRDYPEFKAVKIGTLLDYYWNQPSNWPIPV